MSQALPHQAATDGSVAAGNGTFSWIISTIDEMRLSICHCPVYRRAPTSYHTKCYGLLSLLRLQWKTDPTI